MPLRELSPGRPVSFSGTQPASKKKKTKNIEMIKTQPAQGCVYSGNKSEAVEQYLPDCVKICSPWHRIFARFGLEDLVVVHRFPVHDRESKRTRLISLSHSKNTERRIKQIYSSRFILDHQIIVAHRDNVGATAPRSDGHLDT